MDDGHDGHVTLTQCSARLCKQLITVSAKMWERWVSSGGLLSHRLSALWCLRDYDDSNDGDYGAGEKQPCWRKRIKLDFAQFLQTALFALMSVENVWQSTIDIVYCWWGFLLVFQPEGGSITPRPFKQTDSSVCRWKKIKSNLFFCLFRFLTCIIFCNQAYLMVT